MAARTAVPLVETLCRELAGERIRYCHWKSNAAIERSASGENDLDLLVARSNSQAFLAVLARLGFKQTWSLTDSITPGVHNFYGYDASAGVLVNVHAHFQLVLGHDATKNYLIPCEEAYIGSSAQGDVFRLPAPEFELILFVVRMAIKHFTWDSLLLGQGRIGKAEKDELEYLVQHSSMPRVDELLARHLPWLEGGAFQSVLVALTAPHSAFQHLRAGRLMMHCLAPFARRPRLADAALKIWRRFAWPIRRRIFRQDFRKRMNSGGLVAAIIGGDGAGKTTAVDGVFNWLAPEFAVRQYHMGKPRWSGLTILIRGLIKVGRTLGFYPFQRAEIEYTNDTSQLVFPGYPWLIREVCTARDRYLTYRKARRFAAEGGLVILDRFPLPQIKFMDGPVVARMTSGVPSNRFIRLLERIELNYYRKISLPDLLIVLRVDPQVAVERKVTEVEKEVRARSTEIWELDWEGTPAQVLDASPAQDAVLSQVKELIWSWL